MTGDLETARLDETFDVISIVQVIAHFREPKNAMQIIAGLVRPGGYLLIESWNRASLTARAFGRKWHEYSPPSVLHWFSRDGLLQLGKAAGFAPVEHGRPLKILNGGHAKALLEYKLAGGRVAGAASRIISLIPDKIPIIYPFGDVVWILLRKV